MQLKQVRQRLEAVKEMGFVETMRSGNTGVGYTLETLLGVEENNSSGADIDGEIELKAKRKNGNSRTTSFCQNPIWLKKSRDIIREYGWQDSEKPNRLNFYPSLRCNVRSPQGLMLNVEKGSVFVIGKDNEKLAELPMEVIRFRFRQKFKNLLIVNAENRKEPRQREQFHYNEAYYCSELSAKQIESLLLNGKMVMEPRMWLDKETGKLRDRGFAIRLSDKWTKELFAHVRRVL